MQPTKFEQCNRHLDFPNGESLDFFQDDLSGKVIMLWQFDEEERKRIADTGQLYISQVLGQTAVPLLEVPFREITDEERAEIEAKRKLQAEARTHAAKRNFKERHFTNRHNTKLVRPKR